MRLESLICTMLFLIPYCTQATESLCTCDRDKLLANVRAAETIFYGSIRDAKMESATSETIQLTLEIRDPIRGKNFGTVKISTTLPHNCGVRATLGMHSLFVLPSNNEPVTICGGSGLHHYQEGHELYDLNRIVYALITIEYVDTDPDVVRSWLNRSYSGGYSRREHMDDFFSLIGELDPGTIMTVTDNEITYRNLVFVFTDDVLVDFFWKDEN